MSDEAISIYNQDGTIKSKEDFLHDVENIYDSIVSESIYDNDNMENIITDPEVNLDEEEIISNFNYLSRSLYITGEISDEERNWMYANCQAFLFPSRLEGFGLPVLEAMRYRCKVFASSYTSLPEICKEHASYFASLNPKEMANTTKTELPKWDKSGKQAETAMQYSLKYNYSTYISQYIALYKKLLHTT